MPRFFIDSLNENNVSITGPDAKHIALSLRMSKGNEIVLSDGKGIDAKGIIESICPDEIIVSVNEKYHSKAEPNVYLTLYQALPKFDKMEFIIQKATELGASKIVPVMTSRCISRPDEKQMKKKIERFRKIAEEAAMQSQRGIIPEIGDLVSFDKALDEIKSADLPIIFYECSDFPLSKAMKDFNGKTISILIGSEGGFSAEEAEKAKTKGIMSLSLGPRILRCETAPIAAISAIMYAAGEME